MILPISLIAAYLLGLGTFWLLDGWFRWTNDMYGDDGALFILGWPISMWWVILRGLRERVEIARRNHDVALAERKKIRIAAEKELQEQMKTLEEELEVEKPRKRARR